MPLARDGDPLITGSGKALAPVGEEDTFHAPERRSPIPQVANIRVRRRTDIDSLPESDHTQQAVIAAIVSLKLIGVSDLHIAEILKTDLHVIQRIVRSESAQLTFERLYQNIIDSNSDLIQGRIASHANRAVDVVVEMMNDHQVKDDVRLKAAQDVLDRAGANPDHFFSETGNQQQRDEELRIVIMDEQTNNSRVSVDIKRKG